MYDNSTCSWRVLSKVLFQLLVKCLMRTDRLNCNDEHDDKNNDSSKNKIGNNDNSCNNNTDNDNDNDKLMAS